MKHVQTRTLIAALLALAAGSSAAQALIDHNKALAGGITPDDTPGYPITISRPGHYKLMGNLTVPAGQGGIAVTASNVTIDLNGFVVAGPIACSRDVDTRIVDCGPNAMHAGIRGWANHITVRNGTVRGFGWGLNLPLDMSNVVEDVVAMHNRYSGIAAGGRINRVAVRHNGSSGVFVAGLISQSTVADNGGNGIVGAMSNRDTLVVDTVATGNRLYGLSTVTVRGTLQINNGSVNRNMTRSAGGNADDSGVY